MHALAFEGPSRRQIVGPSYEHSPRAVTELAVTVWLESSRSMHALCASRDIAYVHALQPTLHDAGSKPLSEAERALPPGGRGWKRGVQQGYPRMRERVAELTAVGVRFLDATGAFAGVTDTLYEDACHVDSAGNGRLEEVIRPALLEVIEGR